MCVLRGRLTGKATILFILHKDPLQGTMVFPAVSALS